MIPPLPSPWVDRYLDRLELERPRIADASSLRSMHFAHLHEIPFECLDVARGIPLSLDAEALCEKVLRRGRGGFCYELNSLFARLLVSLDYRVELLAARVVDREDQLGPPFDHMALRVEGDEAESYLCDVGFGRSFLEPMKLSSAEHEDATGQYRLRDAEHDQLWLEHLDAGEWARSFLLDPAARRLEEFEPMLAYHQRDPASPFSRTFLITRLTEHGRLTVRDLQVTETIHSHQCRWTLESAKKRDTFVSQRFGPQFCL